MDMSLHCTLVLAAILTAICGPTRAAPLVRMRRNVDMDQRRNEDVLPHFDFLPPHLLALDADNEVPSRTAPVGHRPFPDSQVYYIRVPPSPYVFVKGLGYVSRRPPPPPPAAPAVLLTPFINLPIDFVSNGKPTGVYQWAAPSPAPSPAPGASPDTPITQLDKGPYVFNGRSTDLYLLTNTYNSVYADALRTLYP